MRFDVMIGGERFGGDYTAPSGAAAAAALAYEGRFGSQPDGMTAEVAGEDGVVKLFVRRAADRQGNTFDVMEA